MASTASCLIMFDPIPFFFVELLERARRRGRLLGMLFAQPPALDYASKGV